MCDYSFLDILNTIMYKKYEITFIKDITNDTHLLRTLGLYCLLFGSHRALLRLPTFPNMLLA